MLYKDISEILGFPSNLCNKNLTIKIFLPENQFSLEGRSSCVRAGRVRGFFVPGKGKSELKVPRGERLSMFLTSWGGTMRSILGLYSKNGQIVVNEGTQCYEQWWSA